MSKHETKMPALTTLRLGLLAGFLASAGCSESVAIDKSEDPALKASMEKSREIYKSKMQTKASTKKGSTGPAIKRPS